MKKFTIFGIADDKFVYSSHCWYMIENRTHKYLEGFFTLELTSEGFILKNLRTLDDYTLVNLSNSLKEELDKVIEYYNGHKKK